MALNVFTVPPHLPFLEAVARGWLARGDEPLTVSRGLILLPTRRSARRWNFFRLSWCCGQAAAVPRGRSSGTR